MQTIDYRIEKIRCTVTVCLRDGSEVPGDIFLGQLSRFRPEPQDPLEFLNEAEHFFALALDGNGALLVAKQNVALVSVPLAGRWTTLEGGVEVELSLLGGGSRRGRLFPESRSGHSRLLDYLNTADEAFLPLAEAACLTLVHRDAIAHVREVR